MKRLIGGLAMLAFVLGPNVLPGGAAAATQRAGAHSGVTAARAAIAKYERQPKFIGPKSTLDMKRLKGKSVWIIAVSLGIPFTATVAHGVQSAASVAGIKTHLFDGKATQSEWQRGISEAVSQHANGVVLIGVPLPLVTAALQSMQSAHIPFIDVPADCKATLPFGEFSHVCISFSHAGALQADYVIANAGTAATHVLLLEDNEYPAEENRLHGMQSEFKHLAPQDTVTTTNTLTSQNATQLGSTVVSAIRRDPKIKWVVATYDAQLVYVVPALQQAGMANSVKVVGSDAVASNLAWVKQSHVQVADVGEPDGWMGWASLDLIGRAMLKQSPANEHIQVRLFTPNNLRSVGSVGNENHLFGGDYRAKYKSLWGLK